MSDPVVLNLAVPDGGNLFVKVQDKQEITETKTSFRSFRIHADSRGNLIVRSKLVDMVHLYNLVKERGGLAASSFPIEVTLNSPPSFVNFDWNPYNYPNCKQIIYFDWKGVHCSLTGNRNDVLWIRVHDLTEGIGEQILAEISDELFKHAKELPPEMIHIYTPQKTGGGYCWYANIQRQSRSFETIYLNETLKTSVVSKLKNFYATKELYERYGVHWKFVTLLHGPPGVGKTSMILACASFFKKNIAKITLTPEMTGIDLEGLIHTVPANSMLVMEDVDGMFADRGEKKGVDLSTVLNCLDGLTTPGGLVAFLTTNYIHMLDAAFLRPGRIDNCVEFKLPTKLEFQLALTSLGKSYEHEHEAFLNHIYDVKMGRFKIRIAELQKFLFDCIVNNRTSLFD